MTALSQKDHTALAAAEIAYGWDWPRVEKEFRRALELDPNNSATREYYSEYLSMFGRRDEALMEIRRAQELDPLSPMIQTLVGTTLYWARRYDLSIQQLQRTLGMEPAFAWAHFWLARGYEQEGKLGEAIAESQQAVSSSGGNLSFVGGLGHAYALAGRRREALEIAQRLKALRNQRYVKPSDIAMVYTGLDDHDQVFEWLQKACDERDDSILYLAVDPMADSLRSDPRYTALVKRIGFLP